MGHNRYKWGISFTPLKLHDPDLMIYIYIDICVYKYIKYHVLYLRTWFHAFLIVNYNVSISIFGNTGMTFRNLNLNTHTSLSPDFVLVSF